MSSLLNQTAVRDYILERVKTTRPGWTCTEVSERVFKIIEDKLKTIIDKTVHSHPTKGRTFSEIL
jgi:hypothetical protein